LSEQINNIKVYSLLEVSNSIKKTITERYKRSFWVKAEMNRLNYYPHSGHCYPELVEKQNGKLVVNMRANLWKDDYQRINNKFIKVLNEPLKDYITILINVTVSFETLYGLTLRIIDIDPAYTLGELEREKQETIGKLKQEGIFDNNKRLILPVLPKRIAVISVKTSKGYADFAEVINSKKGIYKFIGKLFPAILQGDNAVKSIMDQLNKIETISDQFDIVAIIRGGGGDVGLSCYNNYEFAKRIALYPIPVLTGIGHSTNETVVEMVSNQNSITPTRLAEFLIEKFHSFSLNIQQFERIICDEAKKIIQDEKLKIRNSTRLFNSVSKNHLQNDNNNLKNLTALLKHNITFHIIEAKNLNKQVSVRIINSCNNYITRSLTGIKDLKTLIVKHCPILLEKKKKEIANISKNIELLDPINVLKRGYSITYLNGRSVRSHSEVKVDSEVNTVLYKGSFISKITSVKKREIK